MQNKQNSFLSSSKKFQIFLFQRGVYWFGAFFLFALIAFWKNYYSFPDKNIDFYTHFHGIVMTVWVLLLIGQASLIRYKKYNTHRLLGRSSYLIVPLLVISTVLLVHANADKSPDVDLRNLYRFALMLNATFVLALIYGLGIYYFNTPMIHARFMISTVFPMFTPVTDRIIAHYIRPLINYAPKLGDITVLPFYGFLLADLILIGLIFWDWKANRRLDVFVYVLGLLVLFHISVFTLPYMDFWEKFGRWFVTLSIT